MIILLLNEICVRYKLQIHTAKKRHTAYCIHLQYYQNKTCLMEKLRPFFQGKIRLGFQVSPGVPEENGSTYANPALGPK